MMMSWSVACVEPSLITRKAKRLDTRLVRTHPQPAAITDGGEDADGDADDEEVVDAPVRIYGIPIAHGR